MFVDFCIPAHNEERLLKSNILKLWKFCCDQNFEFDWRIVIAINGSTDNSLAIARSLSSKGGSAIEYINLEKAGKGRAIKECARRSQADVLVYMDIDLAVSLGNIRELVATVTGGEYDMVIASRLLPFSQTKRSRLRSFSSSFYNTFARLILKDGIRDHQCGFKVLSSNIIHSRYFFIQDDHWFFDTELIARVLAGGYSVAEMPVDWEENRYDKRKSKVRVFRDGVVFLFKLLQLRFKINSQRSKSRV